MLFRRSFVGKAVLVRQRLSVCGAGFCRVPQVLGRAAASLLLQVELQSSEPGRINLRSAS
jgi:hypothetical protein